MKRPKKIAQHNYVRKIASMAKTGALPRDVGYHQVSVSHDDWCGIFQQRRCNCDPDVRLRFSLPTVADN